MTGQVLMEIADLNQDLELQLKLPEKRDSHLEDYIRENDLTEVEVTYILATDTTMDPLSATLKRKDVSLRAEADQENGAVILMDATPDQAPLRKLSPSAGSSVIAKVKCGRAASGYVLFHEIYEWLCKFFF